MISIYVGYVMLGIRHQVNPQISIFPDNVNVIAEINIILRSSSSYAMDITIHLE